MDVNDTSTQGEKHLLQYPLIVIILETTEGGKPRVAVL